MFGYSLSNSCVTLTWKNLFLFQEEEERKRKEEQERKEHEEYLLLKEQFTVEEEGVGETAEEVSDYHAVIEACIQDSLTSTYCQMTSCLSWLSVMK